MLRIKVTLMNPVTGNIIHTRTYEHIIWAQMRSKKEEYVMRHMEPGKEPGTYRIPRDHIWIIYESGAAGHKEDMGTCYKCKEQYPIGRGDNFHKHPTKEEEWLCNNCHSDYVMSGGKVPVKPLEPPEPGSEMPMQRGP